MDRKINKSDSRGYIARYKGSFLDWKTFEGHVGRVRKTILCTNALIENAKVLNLCADRYHFLVVFTASMLENRTTVMPSNRSDGELARMVEANPGIKKVRDTDIEQICQNSEVADTIQWSSDLIQDSMVVAEVFTSGSTGNPRSNPKTWGQLVNGIKQVYARFDLNNTMPSIIATVPPQHMFGFEMSILMPLVSGACIHHAQPFYPLDIQHALADMPSPRVLITTPIHLKACLTVETDWPDVSFIMSATAPLPHNVAEEAEDKINTEIKEVYGCSEVGAIATRQMTKSYDWELFSDYRLSIEEDKALLQVPACEKTIELPDKLEIKLEGYFSLIGRTSDLIKIGGKRGSISEIITHIKSIEGVSDAVVFRPDDGNNDRFRLAALVVAPKLTLEQLRGSLVKDIDPVFMPRPLCIVSELPYNSVGKLPIKSLLENLKKYKSESKLC